MTAKPQLSSWCRWALGLALGLSAAVSPSLADQTDPELPRLFSDLAASETLAEAAPLEAQIWNRWYEVDDPGAEELMMQGVEHLAAGDLDFAEETFTRLIELRPDFAEAWNRRATTRYLNGDFEGSVRDIAQTLVREPRHFGALSGFGMILDRLENYTQARAAYLAALAVHPHLPHALTRIEALEKLLGERGI